MNPNLTRKRIALTFAGAALITAGTAGAVAAASSSSDDDEESEYELEVTLDDGTQVDVQLDEDFRVVGTDPDSTEDEPAEADD